MEEADSTSMVMPLVKGMTVADARLVRSRFVVDGSFGPYVETGISVVISDVGITDDVITDVVISDVGITDDAIADAVISEVDAFSVVVVGLKEV